MTHQLEPAQATRPGDVVDAHVHLFTVGLLAEMLAKDPNPNPRFKQALKERRFGRRNDPLPDLTPEETAALFKGSKS